MTRPFDPIELVELGYVARAGTRDWMRAMAGPILRCIDAGPAPAYAYCLDPNGPEETVCWTSGQSEAEALADLWGAFRPLFIAGAARDRRRRSGTGARFVAGGRG